jgi:hypothetical protein
VTEACDWGFQPQSIRARIVAGGLRHQKAVNPVESGISRAVNQLNDFSVVPNGLAVQFDKAVLWNARKQLIQSHFHGFWSIPSFHAKLSGLHIHETWVEGRFSGCISKHNPLPVPIFAAR